MQDDLKNVLENFIAASRPYVAVEAVDDPEMPGRTAYRVESLRREHAQARIGELCEQAADQGGYANFVGPHRTREGTYLALGEAVVPQPQVCA